MPDLMQLRVQETGRVLVARLEKADTAWKRTVGLLGRARFAQGEGLWLEPCSGIHTLGMRFPIDVLFLDKEGRAVRLVSGLRPWRFCGFCRRARIVVELPARTLAAADIEIGDQFCVEESARTKRVEDKSKK